jgi:hypothetical protein
LTCFPSFLILACGTSYFLKTSIFHYL